MATTQTQPHVERLLAQIRDRVDELERLRARGIRGRPLAEREQELSQVRGQLARTVSHRREIGKGRRDLQVASGAPP